MGLIHESLYGRREKAEEDTEHIFTYLEGIGVRGRFKPRYKGFPLSYGERRKAQLYHNWDKVQSMAKGFTHDKEVREAAGRAARSLYATEPGEPPCEVDEVEVHRYLDLMKRKVSERYKSMEGGSVRRVRNYSLAGFVAGLAADLVLELAVPGEQPLEGQLKWAGGTLGAWLAATREINRNMDLQDFYDLVATQGSRVKGIFGQLENAYSSVLDELEEAAGPGYLAR